MFKDAVAVARALRQRRLSDPLALRAAAIIEQQEKTIKDLEGHLRFVRRQWMATARRKQT